MAVIFLATGTSWEVPYDWNPDDNSIECIGGGGDGSATRSDRYSGPGGGGGAYSKITNLTLTPESFVDYIIGGVAGDTWFKDIATVLAKGGETATFNKGLGGQAAEGVGDVKYSGGDGYKYGVDSTPGGGGGGAAGLNGDGDSSTGTDGGDGDAGYGGAGGSYQSGNGGDGQEYDATHGSGGGGAAGEYPGGGDGGLYGGAGGGGNKDSEGTYPGGDGKQGLIVITYEPLVLPPNPPTNVQATDGVHTDKVVITWTKSDGATGYQVYRDDTPLGWLGDVATFDDTGAGAPSITPGSAIASDGEHAYWVALSLAGQSANNGATHTYKVRAKNAEGESGDSDTDTGYRGVGELTYQWQRSAADSDADYSNIDGATTASYNDTGAPEDGSGRYYRCIENATGAAQQISAVDRGYRGEVGFDDWLDLSIQNVIAVASCSLAAEVSQFYINTAKEIYHRLSANNGIDWGAWTHIDDVETIAVCGFDATYKANGDICLVWLDQPTLFELCITEDDQTESVHGDMWIGQTFTPATTHTLDNVLLKIFRLGSPGTLTMALKLVNGEGEPTGADLATGTLNANTITDESPGQWYKISMTPYELTADTTYCIIAKALTGDGSNKVQWRWSSENPYPGGTKVTTLDAGVDWGVISGADMMFQELGYTTPASNPSTIHTLKRLSTVWQSIATCPYPLANSTGASVFHEDDWNIVLTYGATGAVKGVDIVIFGDGVKQAAGTWSAFQTILQRGTTEPWNYHAPCVRRPDTTRLYFVENFTQEETQERMWYSHAPPSATFDLNAWLEPVPMNLETEYGLAFTQHGSYAWLTNANRVFRALATENELVLSARLLEIDSRDYPDIFKGSLRVVIDNTGGWYDAFDRLGQQLEVGIGYVTSEGNEFSLMPYRWITKFKLKAPPWYPLRMIFPIGVIGTLEIKTEDAWNLLYRYRTRRHLEWAADTKSVKELLQFFIARCGLDFDVISQSDAVQNFKPFFEVRTGTSYRTAIKNLLKMVPDQLVFREGKVLLRNPTTVEAIDWTYHNLIGTALLVFRGDYGKTAWTPNRAEVWGDTFMKMKANWEQVAQVRDRLSRVTTPTYPDLTRAAERADAELRRAEILTGGESIMVAPTNCGLEPWDVLQITDLNAGVTNIKRRVLRVKAYWNAKHWSYQQIITLGAD